MILARVLLTKKILMWPCFKLNKNLFRSIEQSSYFRAFCTSDPTVNEQKESQEKDVLVEENKVLLNKYKRALAENENTRKRAEKQLEDMKSYAIQDFSKDLLEISDNLDLALESAKMNNKENLEIKLTSLYKGLQITKDSLEKIFAKHGLVQIIPKGQVFDPEKHDALYQVSSENYKPGDVVKVLKSGYALNGRVIRPAKVAVAPVP